MITETDETKEEYYESAKRRADPEFANHVIKQETENCWRCQRPGTGYFSFRVVVAPGHIILLGDLYSQVFAISSLEELVSDVGSMRWVMRSALHPTKVFFAKDALAYPIERIAEETEEFQSLGDSEEEEFAADKAQRARCMTAIEKWRKLHSTYLDCLKYELGGTKDGQQLWQDAWVDVVEDTHYPECEGWDSRLLWQYHALKTFVRLYKQYKIDTQPPASRL